MKIVLKVLIAGGVIVVSGGRAEAQARLASLEVVAPAADTAALAARVDEALRTFREGRLQQARRELEVLARAQEEAGMLPGAALWQLAEAYSATGDRLRAAATLDRLARAAELHGDPVLQARALFESTIYYQQAGVRDRAHERYTRLLPLLRSPYMPAEVRQSLRARIVTRR
jgi:tetratricopeptide (TPR) repeat protein